MNDQIEDLFADLRAGEIPALRPPGTEPLRRAARRRRAALPAAGAAMAVVALAGLTVLLRPDTSSTPPAAPPASGSVRPGILPGPDIDEQTLNTEVAEALDLDPLNPLPGAIVTDTGNGPREIRRILLGGSYTVKLNCFGTGSMDVTVTVATTGKNASATAVEVPCSTDQQTVLTVPVEAPEPTGKLTVRVVPDVTGPGQAAFGFAQELAQPDQIRWQERASIALGKPRYPLVFGTFFMNFGRGYEDPERDSGRRIQAVCVGTGTAVLMAGPEAEPGPDTKQVRVPCSPTDPDVVTMTYDSTGPLHTVLRPDEDSSGRAAGAVSVVAD